MVLQDVDQISRRRAPYGHLRDGHRIGWWWWLDDLATAGSGTTAATATPGEKRQGKRYQKADGLRMGALSMQEHILVRLSPGTGEMAPC
ncbi:MAG: hypothetical protein F4X40_05750 [Chloroflexi bacterium]|nr:hypothetical protein [Chloroflexota bacterium]